MSEAKILIVEDEVAIREMIVFHLTRAGFSVLEAGDCGQARALIADQCPDLLLVDWMLPDMSGLEFTRDLKRNPEHEDMAVIMLTARVEEQDKVSGLEGGSDDYITKPFAPRELVARIHAVLRRSRKNEVKPIRIGALQLDPVSHRVTADGVQVQLGPTEYRMLKFLMMHPDRVYSRAQLLDRVWGANVYVEERTVDVHIRRLRKALAEYACDGCIQTVRSAGYRLSERNS